MPDASAALGIRPRNLGRWINRATLCRKLAGSIGFDLTGEKVRGLGSPVFPDRPGPAGRPRLPLAPRPRFASAR